MSEFGKQHKLVSTRITTLRMEYNWMLLSNEQSGASVMNSITSFFKTYLR